MKMETKNLMENITKKLIPSISPIINAELDLFLKMEISKIEERLIIENKEVLAVEMDKLKQESERNSQEREELEKMRVEYLEKTNVLEEKLRETSEHIDATKKVSIYQRYEKTIDDKNGEIKIMSFRLKSLEEQLRKAREKCEKSNDTINGNSKVSMETEQKVVTTLEPEPKPEPLVEPVPEPLVEPKPEPLVEPKPEPLVEPEPQEVSEEEEEETELEWVVHKKKNYLTDNDYLYNENDLDKAVGYKTKKGNWKLY